MLFVCAKPDSLMSWNLCAEVAKMRHLKQSAVKCLVVFLMPGFAFSPGERTGLQAGLQVASGI